MERERKAPILANGYLLARQENSLSSLVKRYLWGLNSVTIKSALYQGGHLRTVIRRAWKSSTLAVCKIACEKHGEENQGGS